ncbi:hypothetical protein MW887_007606 [Aspergillus wentii]|nr:hypothetical protein MW887_007606 [Aspergillus wentii]
MRSIDLHNTSSAYYAPGVISGSQLHIAGQAGAIQNPPSDYVSQIHLALLNLHRIITAAGASVRDIVKLNLYIVHYNPANRAHTRPLQKFLGSHRPAITLVPVSQLAVPGWLFEIDAVVEIPPRLTRSLTPASAVEETDVVVIGAGLSGLTAAEKILQSGHSCIILEARDRVGGRTWSQPLEDNGVVDLGAAWINDTNQSRMIALARRAGAELIEQNIVGNGILQREDKQRIVFPYGTTPKITAQIQQEMERLRDEVEADCQKVDCSRPVDVELDSLTFLAYLQRKGASEAAIANASVWTRAMLGHEPQDLSALYFLNYCKSGGGLLQMRSDGKHGAQYLRVRQGTQIFATTLAAALPPSTLRLNHPVTSIHQLSSQNILIESAGRTIRARKVISSVPTPVLKTITFNPPLPPKKKLLTDSFRYGYYTKVMLVFRSPWWVERGFCGLAQSFHGPVSVFRDTSSPNDKKYVLTSFLAGDAGRAWSALPTPKDREDALLAQLGDIYGDPALPRAEFIQSVGHEWSMEKFSGEGCPCPALPPGVLSIAGDALREPVGDVHFVGTETAAEWKGYMEGAVRSGERGSEEVLDGFRRVVARL